MRHVNNNHRSRTPAGWRVLIAAAAVLLPLSMAAQGHALVTGNLTLSQIGGFGVDGNFHLDSGETYDWANAGGSNGPATCSAVGTPGNAGPLGTLGLFCVNDKPTGQNDNSLNGHESDSSVQAVCGSIPNNKSDLTNFYVASQAVSGFTGSNPVHSILYLGWTRVSTNGSADMDFEFNQKTQDANLSLSTCPGGNGATVKPNRSDGDLLVEYQFGGNAITIKLTKWITSASDGSCAASSDSVPCWSTETDLTAANEANGAINDSSTTGAFDCLSPNGKTVSGCIANELAPSSSSTLQPDTFGEAAIDLSAALGSSTCETLGSAYLKSRSSAVFTDALKDYIAPVAVHVTNCVTPNVATSLSPATATLGSSVTDTVTVSSFIGSNPPGGRVAFNVYSGTGSTACTGTPLRTVPTGASSDGTNGDTLTAGTGGTARATETITSGTSLSPGHYEVQAVYTGDGGSNLSNKSTCGSEPLQINKATATISTQSSTGSPTVGTQATISDTATLANLVTGVAPTGSVAFTLYTDSGCTSPATYAAGDTPNTGNVTGSGTISGGSASFTTHWTPTLSPATNATYTWGISWAGDSNYNPIPSSGTGVQCGGSNETITVQKATPGVSTQIRLDDIATVTGGYSPTGTVTFKLYSTADCSGSVVAEFDTVAISGGKASTVGLVADSGSSLVSSGLTYSWKVIYNGDGNNNSVTVGCTTANHETAQISYAP